MYFPLIDKRVVPEDRRVLSSERKFEKFEASKSCHYELVENIGFENSL